ncbi:helix-turn-helix domain-containing protein [Actinotignum urinale]|uniref:helix-turn-helix domain-containing protein n=1 Tax=Actinotignum urinale TaxID=190146 RepID=UPI00370D7539
MLTTGEAAAIFQVSRQSIYSWCKKNWLTHQVLPNGHYRIPRSEIDRFMVLSGTQESVHHVPVLPGQSELCI